MLCLFIFSNSQIRNEGRETKTMEQGLFFRSFRACSFRICVQPLKSADVTINQLSG